MDTRRERVYYHHCKVCGFSSEEIYVEWQTWNEYLKRYSFVNPVAWFKEVRKGQKFERKEYKETRKRSSNKKSRTKVVLVCPICGAVLPESCERRE